jgi:hypothetical protein
VLALVAHVLSSGVTCASAASPSNGLRAVTGVTGSR